MTRPEFLRPEELTAAVVCDVLELVDVHASKDIVGQWTEMEMLIAYDWAMRRYYAASDSLIRQRDKPWIVTVASSSPLVTALKTTEMSLHECIRRILSEAPDGVTTKNLLLKLSVLGFKSLDTRAVEEILDEDDDIGMSEDPDPDARWLWCPLVTP